MSILFLIVLIGGAFAIALLASKTQRPLLPPDDPKKRNRNAIGRDR